MKFPLHLLVGSTGSGKTTLLIDMAERFRRKGYFVVYLSDLDSKRPDVQWIASDIDEAIDVAKSKNNSAIFVDEFRLYSDTHLDFFEYLAFSRRHARIALVTATQRPQFVSPSIRDLLTLCFLFRSHGRALTWIDENFEFSNPDIYSKVDDPAKADKIRRRQQRTGILGVSRLPDYYYIKYSITENKPIAKGKTVIVKEKK